MPVALLSCKLCAIATRKKKETRSVEYRTEYIYINKIDFSI